MQKIKAINQKRQNLGFTFLEVLVVMAIIGVIMAIAVPNIQKAYKNYQETMLEQEIEKQFREISFKVYKSGQNYLMSNETLNNAINLPEGCTVLIDTPILYRYDGICKGGILTLETPYKTKRYSLESPFCFPLMLEEHVKE